MLLFVWSDPLTHGFNVDGKLVYLFDSKSFRRNLLINANGVWSLMTTCKIMSIVSNALKTNVEKREVRTTS